MMSRVKITAVLLLLFNLIACTPEYFRRQSEELAGVAHLRDSIDIERGSERLLTRQVQICLLSPDGGGEVGAELLRTIQAGFSGYFLAVGVVGESIDYLRAVSSAPCPGASFLFYVQPADHPTCDNAKACNNIASQFIITIISIGDQSLVDRIKFSIKTSFLPTAASERERRQKAFEQLAIALTGGK